MDETKSNEISREVRGNVDMVTLGADEWQSYRDLRIKAHSQEPAAFRESAEQIAQRSEGDWRKRLSGGESGGDILLFAKSESELVGLIGMRLQKAENLRQTATIFFVYVDAEKRGQGIGNKLIEAAMAKLRGFRFVHKVKLNVFSTQRTALELYKKFGFKEVGVKKDRLSDSTQYRDHLLMEKLL